MRKILVVLGMVVGLSLAARSAMGAEIKDVKQTDWAYNSIQYLVDKGYLALYEDNTFRGDNSVSRTVLAAALMKLIDQIKSGEIKAGASDIAEIKKLSDSFKSEISDFENRMKALEQRLGDTESKNVVTQQDLTKAMVEYRDGFDELSAADKQMRQDIGILTDEVKSLGGELEKERKDRKRSQTTMWIGIAVAAIVGAASN